MNWFRRLRFVFRKDRAGIELDEELRFHLEHQIEENLATGMPSAEARLKALREFGIVGQIKEECWSSRGMDWLDRLAQDVRHSLRGYRRNPAFTLTVLAITAIGIGATTAVFSVVDRVLFRGLPYPDSSRLVSVGIAASIMPFDFLTGRAYIELRQNPAPLASVTSSSDTVDCDLTENHPVRLACARVESTFLPVLGIRPLAGRNFTAEEDRPGAPRVALISEALWRTRFGARQDAIGQRLSLDGQAVLIVGVLPPHFELPALDRADIVMPQLLPPDIAPGYRPLRVYARLAPGMGAEQARAAMDPFAGRLINDAPPQFRKEVRFRIRTLRDQQTGDLRIASWTLFGAVLSMLLIACANVANLLLARSISRQRELAIRSALGAGRLRLVRQTLVENLLLALAGGAAGCVLADLLLRIFVAIAPVGIPHLAAAQLDLRVLLFALAASVLCGLAFGLAPAVRAPRPEALTGTRIAGSHGASARQLLVGAQLVVSLALLTSAGLLLQSLWNRQTVPLGIRTDRILTAQLALGMRYTQPQARIEFFEQVESRLRRLPGVESVALSDTVPPGGITRTQPFYALQPEGTPPFERGTGGLVTWRAVTPEYFRALGIPIRRGRAFTEEDRAPNSHSIVVSESLASRLFPNGDALHRQFRRYREQPTGQTAWYTIIGIAADVRNTGLTDENHPEYYIVRRHGSRENDDAPSTSVLILRGSATQQALESWMRAEISALDPVMPVTIRTFREHVGELAARPRFQASLLFLFAAVGLLLAASGLYGLISFLVAQRQREIGLRLALGATPVQIGKMIMGQALRWTAGGLAGGLIASALAAWALRSLLFHVSATDPLTFGAAIVTLLTLALVAAYVPSRRAATLDPITTLRQD